MRTRFDQRCGREAFHSRAERSCRVGIRVESRLPYVTVAAAFAGALLVATTPMAMAGEDCSAEPEVLTSGRVVAEQACARCHGLEGHGDPENRQMTRLTTPDLAGQSAQYLAGALKGYAKGYKWQEDPDSVFFTEGMRVNDYMGQVAVKLDSDGMQAVAYWYHCQE